MTYVSTGGLPSQSVEIAVESLYDHGIDHIELSGGPPNPSIMTHLSKWASRVGFALHHYFPAPEIPFVVNLASTDPAIAAKSIAHVQTAISLARDLGSHLYSFHAGYLIDPMPQELGHPLVERRLIDESVGERLFIERVCAIAHKAGPTGVDLLIENNVITRANLNRFGTNPLLMTGPEDTVRVMRQMPDNVGMLVDVGHLTVSATTLGFDRFAFLQQCAQWTRGFHLSENGGIVDSNDPLTNDAWFWPHLGGAGCFKSVEVYGLSAADLAAQARLVDTLLAEGETGHTP